MSFDHYTISADGPVNLRFRTPEGFRREVRNPGDDISDLPGEVQAEIAKAWQEKGQAWAALRREEDQPDA